MNECIPDHSGENPMSHQSLKDAMTAECANEFNTMFKLERLYQEAYPLLNKVEITPTQNWQDLTNVIYQAAQEQSVDPTPAITFVTLLQHHPTHIADIGFDVSQYTFFSEQTSQQIEPHQMIKLYADSETVLPPALFTQWEKIRDAMPPGEKPYISSGYRSPAYQALLFFKASISGHQILAERLQTQAPPYHRLIPFLV